jgi:hypothetical protein
MELKMANWKKLTSAGDGQAVYVNLDMAASVIPSGDGSIIVLSGPSRFDGKAHKETVKETPDEVMAGIFVGNG